MRTEHFVCLPLTGYSERLRVTELVRLKVIVAVWPELLGHIKAAIKALVGVNEGGYGCFVNFRK